VATMSTLSFDIRSKHYEGGACVIQDLAFTAKSGEFIAIVGPSGAGKTTLLKVIGALDQDFEGTVQVPGDATLSFVFQEPRLMPWLTVQQNLQLVKPTMDRAELTDMLERVGLQHCRAMFPSQLSGGMQRRVALLRAFVVTPQILLMDEPFQSLDAPTADHLRSQLSDLWQDSQPTVFFVTHSLMEALSLADRVLFLSSGPSKIILDLPVDLLRPRGIESMEIQSLSKTLLETYPRLLKGSLQAA
jgi:ABC-type nitrate/sulfonate/bicarbonate transport system ATPase subunit